MSNMEMMLKAWNGAPAEAFRPTWCPSCGCNVARMCCCSKDCGDHPKTNRPETNR